MKAGAGGDDRRLLMWLCVAMVGLIAAVSLIPPQSQENDPRPEVSNIGPHGAKAAYLTLQALGVKAVRWDGPLTALNAERSDAEVRRTTLVLAAPEYEEERRPELAAAVRRFLERGGRVLATGPSGALLLPDGDVSAAGWLESGACRTMPEGPGELARAGRVRMVDSSGWLSAGPQYQVEQRCGRDAVVVEYAVGRGEAVWWSSAAPLENAELKQDADLKLLLSSVGVGQGDGREVVFDESLYVAAKTLWDVAKGLPLGWLGAQAGLVLVLLVLSFSRGHGPERDPVRLPRSSPVEFAESMGDLYAKANGSSVATEAARRRLLRVVSREARVTPRELEEGPEGIAAALSARLGGDWRPLCEHLQEADRGLREAVTPGSALRLVRAMNEDARRVMQSVRRRG